LLIEPGTSLPARKEIRSSQEVLCVLKGSLQLTYEDQIIQLAQGDAAHFWTKPDKQYITNISKALAVALWVGTI